MSPGPAGICAVSILYLCYMLAGSRLGGMRSADNSKTRVRPGLARVGWRVTGRPGLIGPGLWPLLVALPQPVEGGLGDLPPAVVDGQRVAAVRELTQVGDGRRAVVQPPGGHADRRRDGVVLAARGDQQRPPGLVARVDLGRR